MAILTIARLTLREAARRRLLLIVALLTLLVVGFTSWGFQRLLGVANCGPANQACSPSTIKGVTATLLILVTFMFSFVFSLGAVFVAAPAIATDLESGIALAMLPRPIRRSDVVLGKWLGLSAIVGGYTIATSGLEFLMVSRLTGYLPPEPLVAILYLTAESLALLALTLLVSTRLAPMAGGIIVLVLFGIAWMGGIAEAIGVAFHNAAISNVGTATSLLLPTDGLWRGALYRLEPSILIAATGGERALSANPFLVAAPASGVYTLWALLWIAAMLGLTIVSFRRREL